MVVTIQLFAAAREVTGAAAVSIELPGDATIGDAKRTLVAMFPQIAGLLSRSAIAKNQDYAQDTDAIMPTDELAVIPPVSGG